MGSICGAECNGCRYGMANNCKGCEQTKGCPFGKQCFIAKYILTGGKAKFEEFKKQLIEEINSLDVFGMPKITELFALNGGTINIEYTLPNGQKAKLLNNDENYLGTQVKAEFSDGEDRCFGIASNMSFILVSEYGPNGTNPELVIYKKR